MSRSSHQGDFEYAAYEDDYRGFDIRDDESSRGPLILALALGVLIVFAAVVWNTYRQGVRASEDGLPIIAGADTPYKRAPQERGGTMTPDLNARIYDQIDGSARPEDVQNIAVDAPVTADLPPLPGGDVLSGGPANRSPAPAPPANSPIVLEQARRLETLGGAQTPSEGTQLAALNPRLPAPDPAPALSVAPSPSSVPTPLARFDFSADGQYLVQISALRSEDAAERAWQEATRKSPDLFLGADKRIQRADLGAKGVFYRLRVGAFAERAAASEFCSALKSAKHQCIVVQK